MFLLARRSRHLKSRRWQARERLQREHRGGWGLRGTLAGGGRRSVSPCHRRLATPPPSRAHVIWSRGPRYKSVGPASAQLLDGTTYHFDSNK